MRIGDTRGSRSDPSWYDPISSPHSPTSFSPSTEEDQHNKRLQIRVYSSGSYNSPPDLRANRKVSEIEPQKFLYIMDVVHLVKAKIDTYCSREEPKDRDDIVFLANEFKGRVLEWKDHWDPDKVGKFLDSFSSGKQRAHYANLFGVES